MTLVCLTIDPGKHRGIVACLFCLFFSLVDNSTHMPPGVTGRAKTSSKAREGIVFIIKKKNILGLALQMIT